jgi:hypothetical protein
LKREIGSYQMYKLEENLYKKLWASQKHEIKKIETIIKFKG